MKPQRLGLCLFSLLMALWAPTQALAGGTMIPGYGSQAQPRAGAFSAKADDPSAIYHNPAGLAKLEGTIVHVGSMFVNFSQTFQRAGVYDDCTVSGCPDDGLPYAGQPYAEVENQAHGRLSLGHFAVIPMLAVSSDLGLDLPVTFSFGIFAPSSGSVDRDYKGDYVLEEDPNEPPPPGRYDSWKTSASLLLPSVGAGYRVNDKLDIGVRASWGFSTVEAESVVWGKRNFEEWEGHDSLFRVEARDNFIPAFGLGALYRPNDHVELGLNYRSALHVRASGTGVSIPGSGILVEGLDLLEPKTNPPYKCGPGGTLTEIRSCLEFNLPQVANLGARHIWRDKEGGERADVELNVQWEDWSNASQSLSKNDARTVTLVEGLPVSRVRHNFKDVFSIRLGGAYALDLGDDTLTVRGGIAYDTEAAELSWTRLDQDGFARTTLATGLGYEFGNLRIDLSGGVVLEGTRVVDHGGCNPTEDNLGCDGSGTETPLSERDAPDPVQPLFGDDSSQSPFNAGRYEQGYVFFGTGLTAQF